MLVSQSSLRVPHAVRCAAEEQIQGGYYHYLQAGAAAGVSLRHALYQQNLPQDEAALQHCPQSPSERLRLSR